MRRLLALAALLCGAATAAQAAALRYPQELSPVADGEAADVRVRMTVDDGGAVQKVEVLASSQPERDADVVAALAAWLFPPDRQRERASGWTRERRYRFVAPAQAPALPPVRKPAEAEVQWLPEPGSATQDAGYTPLPNERWLPYPKGEQWSGHDPEVRLEVVVDAAGGIAGARVAEAATPAFGAEALKATLRECECFVWPRDSAPAATVVVVPVRFYTPSVQPKNMKLPEYPESMQRAGLGGQVRVVFTVAADGSVHDPQIFGALHPEFERSVLNAFLRTRFSPALRFGKPAASRNLARYTYGMRRGEQTAPYSVGRSQRAPAALPEAFRYDVPPKVKLATAPVYPLDLALQGRTGSADVLIIINPKDEVAEVRVREAAYPAFGEALQATLQSWRFEPARRKDGEPTWAAIHKEHRFSLGGFSGDGIDADAARILRALKSDGSGIVDGTQLDAPLKPRFQAQPVYPPAQFAAGIGGRAVIEFIVDRNGMVQWPHSISADDEAFGWAAAVAVGRWRFDPPRQDGRPVDVRARVPIAFAPPEAQ